MDGEQRPFREVSLFAGAGGGILGGVLLGWQTILAVENDPFARDVLVSRQNDGSLPPFPIWSNILTFDGKPWRGTADVVSAGFPCQDVSGANPEHEDIEGARSGLFSEVARVLGEIRPTYTFLENSPLLVDRGLALVLGELSTLGYDATWGIIGAHHLGAPHRRNRLWVVGKRRDGDVADSDRKRLEGFPGDESRVDEPGRFQEEERRSLTEESLRKRGAEWWVSEPAVGRVDHGVANRVDRLRCLGNGQVPTVAAFAWTLLKKKLEE